jgi:heme oxygenase
MSLKELTADKHTAAEKSAFMKTVFNKTMSKEVWLSWTFNKMHWYNAIEVRARDAGLLDNLPGIERTYKLYRDFKTMVGNRSASYVCSPYTERYCDYIMDLENVNDVMAHLYVWHMGDLYGGQMIKQILPDFSHISLDFVNADVLKAGIREKLSDDMGVEANNAFDWAITLMNQFIVPNE